MDSLVKSLLLCPCLLCCAAWAGNVGPDEEVVPIDREPSHRPVLSTSSLRVFDALFLPGKVSLYHSHEADSVFVCLEGADVASEVPGKPLTPRPPIPTGDIYYRPYAKQPLVHRVRNLSSTPFRILDIEVLKEPSENPKSLNPLPSEFTVVVDNDRVRVAKLRLASGQSTAEVESSGPRLLAAFNHGRYMISAGSLSPQRPVEVVPGSLDMKDNGTREVITNVGDADLELVRIEIK